MKRTKVVLLITFLIIILVIIISLQLATSQRTKQSPEPTTIFRVVSTSLTGRTISAADTIKIVFSSPVEKDGIKVEISPQTDFLIKSGIPPNEIIVEPKILWSYNTTYSLKILTGSISVSKQGLDRGYDFTFKTTPEAPSYGI